MTGGMLRGRFDTVDGVGTDLDLDRGREAFGRREWGLAYAGLSAADSVVPLELDDLERLAVAAALTGHEADSEDAWARAFRGLTVREADVSGGIGMVQEANASTSKGDRKPGQEVDLHRRCG